MKTSLAIGVTTRDRVLSIATMRHGRAVVETDFPATGIGAEAVGIFLADCEEPIRLAITVADLDLALRWSNGADRETFVVAAPHPHSSTTLARYAATCV
jgi:hypothetical protein